MQEKPPRHQPVSWFLAFALAIVVNWMPHKWSTEKLAVRRAEAVRRGFIVPRPAGYAHILVPDDLALRVKGMANGLAATKSLELLTGLHRRSGSDLAAAACPAVGKDMVDEYLRINRDANSCKHRSFLPKAGRAASSANELMKCDFGVQCAFPVLPMERPSPVLGLNPLAAEFAMPFVEGGEIFGECGLQRICVLADALGFDVEVLPYRPVPLCSSDLYVRPGRATAEGFSFLSAGRQLWDQHGVHGKSLHEHASLVSRVVCVEKLMRDHATMILQIGSSVASLASLLQKLIDSLQAHLMKDRLAAITAEQTAVKAFEQMAVACRQDVTLLGDAIEKEAVRGGEMVGQAEAMKDKLGDAAVAIKDHIGPVRSRVPRRRFRKNAAADGSEHPRRRRKLDPFDDAIWQQVEWSSPSQFGSGVNPKPAAFAPPVEKELQYPQEFAQFSSGVDAKLSFLTSLDFARLAAVSRGHLTISAPFLELVARSYHCPRHSAASCSAPRA